MTREVRDVDGRRRHHGKSQPAALKPKISRTAHPSV
jgi:hypothetical protein